MNIAVLTGRLSKDIELKFMPQSGTAVAKFSLAVDREMSKDKKQEAVAQGKPTADFINITVFGKQAESCSTYLTKGSKCCVHGRIAVNSYTTQAGEKRYSTDIIADKVEFLDNINKQNKVDDEAEEIFKPIDDDDNFPF